MKTPADLFARAADAVRRSVVILPHNDADGLSSAAIALRACNRPASHVTLLPRGVNPYSPDYRPPAGLIAILDQGVRPLAHQSVLVDHHAPEGKPHPEQLVVSGYGEDNVSTSILMKRIFADAAPTWLAALGAAGDYGDAGLKLPEVAGVVKSHVKKLVPLINAPRRLPETDAVRVALDLLVEHDNPKAVLADERIEVLEQARQRWRSAYEAAVRTAPKVVGEVALVRFKSDCQIHPLVAQAWMTRLAPKIVLAANDDYIPGYVNFATRGGREDQDLRAFLKTALPEATGEYAHGHNKATGGSLPHAQFEQLLHNLGF